MIDHPEISFKIQSVFRQLDQDKVTPWAFLLSDMPPVLDFVGRTIKFRGVTFDGTPQHIFWNGFIEPFLEAQIAEGFQLALDHAHKRGLDVASCLVVARNELYNGITSIYRRMQDIDRRLRGSGNPQSVPLRDVKPAILEMHSKVNEYYASAVRSTAVAIENEREQNMKTVFLSYSWKNKNVADFIDSSFHGTGVEIVRDERSVNYTQSIKDFMRRIRGTDYSLLLITEDYLKSVNCMFEVLEIVKDEKFRERILPIVQSDTSIFSPEGRLTYTQFWQGEFDRITIQLQSINPINVPSEYAELRRIEEVLRTVSQFLNVVVDMKCILFAKQIKDSDIQTIKERIGILEDETQIYYILSKTKTILFNENTFVWWCPGRSGYTDSLADAGKYTAEEVKEIVHPFSEDIPYTKMVAIPVAVAKRIFQSQEIIPRNQKFLASLHDNATHLIGDLRWNLPEIMF